jgi:hypothetical protein
MKSGIFLDAHNGSSVLNFFLNNLIYTYTSHHLFIFCDKIKAQGLHLTAHLSFQLIIMLQVFPFEVLFQWSEEAEAAAFKVWNIQWEDNETKVAFIHCCPMVQELKGGKCHVHLKIQSTTPSS